MNTSCRFLATAGTVFLAACSGDPNVPLGGAYNGDQSNLCVGNFAQSELFAAAARGAIPALNRPELDGAQAPFMLDDDRILGVVINGEPRAYPFGILWWHELVNDRLGGVDILVSYCPLTGSGIVFDPTIEGRKRDFVVSGLVYRSNLVMFDEEIGSLWNQMLLGSQCGIDRGRDLVRLPVVETTWEDWKTRYPGTTVVNMETGYDDRPYFAYPYGSYADPENDFVDFLTEGVTWRRDLKTKELVLGVFDGPDAVAYSLETLEGKGASHIVNDQVGSTPFVVVSRSEWNTAQAFDRRVGGQTLTFTMTNPAPFSMTDDQTGSEWDGRGEAISGSLVGERLTGVADSYTAFWFAWALFYPDIVVFE